MEYKESSGHHKSAEGERGESTESKESKTTKERTYPTVVRIPRESEGEGETKCYGFWGRGGEGLIYCDGIVAGEKYDKESSEYQSVLNQINKIVPASSTHLTMQDRLDGFNRLIKSQGSSLEDIYKNTPNAKEAHENFIRKLHSDSLDEGDISYLCRTFEIPPRELYDSKVINERELSHVTLSEMTTRMKGEPKINPSYIEEFKWQNYPGPYHYNPQKLREHLKSKYRKEAEDLVKNPEERRVVKEVLKGRVAQCETLKWFCDKVGMDYADMELSGIFDERENLPMFDWWETRKDGRTVHHEGFGRIADCVKAEGIFVTKRFPNGDMRLYYLTRDGDTAEKFADALDHHKVKCTAYKFGAAHIVRCENSLQSRRVLDLLDRAYHHQLRESETATGRHSVLKGEFANIGLHDVTDVLPMADEVREGETVPVNRLNRSGLVSVYVNQHEGVAGFRDRMVSEFGDDSPVKPLYLEKRDGCVYCVSAFDFEYDLNEKRVGSAPLDGKQGIYREPVKTTVERFRERLFGKKEAASELKTETEKPEVSPDFVVDKEEVNSEANRIVEDFFTKHPTVKEAVSPEKKAEGEVDKWIRGEVDKSFLQDKEEENRELAKKVKEDLVRLQREQAWEAEKYEVMKKANVIFARVQEAHGSMGMLECITLARLCNREGIDQQEISGKENYDANLEHLQEAFLVKKKTLEMNEADALRMQNEWLTEKLSEKEEKEKAESVVKGELTESKPAEMKPAEVKEAGNVGEEHETQTLEDEKRKPRILPNNALGGERTLYFGEGQIVAVHSDRVDVRRNITELSLREINDLYTRMKSWAVSGRTQIPRIDKMTDETYTKTNVILKTFVMHGNFTKNDVATFMACTPEEVRGLVPKEDGMLIAKIDNKANSDRIPNMREGDPLEDVYLQYFSNALTVVYEETDSRKIQISSKAFSPAHFEVLKELFESKAYEKSSQPFTYTNRYGGINYGYASNYVLDSSYGLLRNRPEHIPSNLTDDGLVAAVCGTVDGIGGVRCAVDNSGNLVRRVEIRHRSSFFLNEVAVTLRDRLGVEADVRMEGTSSKLIVEGENAKKLCEKLTQLRNQQNKEFRDLIVNYTEERRGDVAKLNNQYRDSFKGYNDNAKEELEKLEKKETSETEKEQPAPETEKPTPSVTKEPISISLERDKYSKIWDGWFARHIHGEKITVREACPVHGDDLDLKISQNNGMIYLSCERGFRYSFPMPLRIGEKPALEKVCPYDYAELRMFTDENGNSGVSCPKCDYKKVADDNPYQKYVEDKDAPRKVLDVLLAVNGTINGVGWSEIKEEPTKEPTQLPTESPTQLPTQLEKPTNLPTILPTELPTEQPKEPTQLPTKEVKAETDKLTVSEGDLPFFRSVAEQPKGVVGWEFVNVGDNKRFGLDFRFRTSDYEAVTLVLNGLKEKGFNPEINVEKKTGEDGRIVRRYEVVLENRDEALRLAEMIAQTCERENVRNINYAWAKAVLHLNHWKSYGDIQNRLNNFRERIEAGMEVIDSATNEVIFDRIEKRRVEANNPVEAPKVDKPVETEKLEPKGIVEPPHSVNAGEVAELAKGYLGRLRKAGVPADYLDEFNIALDSSKSFKENLQVVEAAADRIIKAYTDSPQANFNTCPKPKCNGKMGLVFGFGEGVERPPTEAGYVCDKCGIYASEEEYRKFAEDSWDIV